MNTAILILGIIGIILLVLTIYSYTVSGKHFKALASGFLATAVAVFVLVIIKNLREQFGIGKDQKEKK
jgi:hypothetical protein